MNSSANRNSRIVRIIRVASGKNLEHLQDLFQKYAAGLGFDLDFQNFEKELTKLPGDYARPDGRLLLALYNKEIAGCVALRELDHRICEMKRLYVLPEFRGTGIGRILTLAAIREAKKIGYKTMRLDTIPAMKQAIILYKALGFKKIKPYRYNPIKGAMFMELTL